MAACESMSTNSIPIIVGELTSLPCGLLPCRPFWHPQARTGASTLPPAAHAGFVAWPVSGFQCCVHPPYAGLVFKVYRSSRDAQVNIYNCRILRYLCVDVLRALHSAGQPPPPPPHTHTHTRAQHLSKPTPAPQAHTPHAFSCLFALQQLIAADCRPCDVHFTGRFLAIPARE